jgi:hypothetical protein
MPARYAAGTDVPTDRSIAEVRRILRNYGATGFVFAEDETRAVIGFVMRDRQVRFALPMPDPKDREFTHTPLKQEKRTPAGAAAEYEKAVRQAYRVFVVVIKAKLAAVQSKLISFDDEFLAFLVLPGGQTVGDVTRPGIAEAYTTGQVPALLPDYPRAIEAGR